MPRGRPKRKQRAQPAPRVKLPEDLDPRQWESSDSEPEDYGVAENEGRWPVDGIIDDHAGENDRISYKVRRRAFLDSRFSIPGQIQWDKREWCRPDGTSQEWIPAPKKNNVEHQQFVCEYAAREHIYFNRQRGLRIVDVVEEDDYPSFGSGPAASKNWYHQTGARWKFYKLERTVGDPRRVGISQFDLDERDFARGECDSGSDSEDDAFPARESEIDGFPAPQPETKREPSFDRLPPSPSLGGSRHPSQATEPSLLQTLQSEWSQSATKIGAAYITLTNTSETPEAIPRLKKTFEYSEMDISWGTSFDLESLDGMFVSCRCTDACDRPHICGCQDLHFVGITENPRALHKFAYTNKGLFRLDHQGVVIECNKKCWCPSNCPNRIAQQPRSVPLDIFTPSIQGWGVRPLRSVKRGQVLGTFTGEILEREQAERMGRFVAAVDMATSKKIQFNDYNCYLFDLDARDRKYTLNCWRYGNWTRFINHSCSPNLKIYPVCYDTLPETGLERLAVVAIKDIRPREELTIDYHPSEAGLSFAVHNRELSQCRCGSQNCRGTTEMVGG